MPDRVLAPPPSSNSSAISVRRKPSTRRISEPGPSIAGIESIRHLTIVPDRVDAIRDGDARAALRQDRRMAAVWVLRPTSEPR